MSPRNHLRRLALVLCAGLASGTVPTGLARGSDVDVREGAATAQDAARAREAYRLLSDEAPRIVKQIRAELEQVDLPAWAGVYSTGGRWPTVLSIAPDTGFTLHMSSTCGNCSGFKAMGRVLRADAGRIDLALDAEFDNTPGSAAFGIDETLFVVPWGELTFAVRAGGMEDFCARASDGRSFPRAPFRGAIATEGIDRPPGLPRVPPEFARLVVAEPVVARITRHIEHRREPEQDLGEHRGWSDVYELDAGTQDGLVVGMRLHVADAERTGRVERAGVSTAVLSVPSFVGVPEDRRPPAAELVGRTVSTRHPQAPPLDGR